MDPIAEFKQRQKTAWSVYAAMEGLTAAIAPRLLRFAGVTERSNLLDVGCGTGVVALTAARSGARVTGIDLTPELITCARENAALMAVKASWHEADVEALPLPDAGFDVVVSQFGHMFAPRPDVAIAEMLRVLRPGGTIAFTSWPPDLYTGRLLTLMAGYAPSPPPVGVSPPVKWGDSEFVRQRLGSAVKDITFAHGIMLFPCLSPQHYRRFMELNFGPIGRLLTALETSSPSTASKARLEIEQLAALYLEDNRLRQDYLMTRAVKL